ncbi:hypothetical protein LR48_Vigan04g101700 [Vigna angularis]|uniref:Uncharacterized protein n=1 Tax=Phaseolus angularis TaxID=3914 RepID=A0A0L9UE47_PHAAN|nr:hypothetical protein LR48_Vigan04g101700 [Vigna angularis]
MNLMKEVKWDEDGIRKGHKKCKRREAASTAQRQLPRSDTFKDPLAPLRGKNAVEGQNRRRVVADERSLNKLENRVQAQHTGAQRPYKGQSGVGARGVALRALKEATKRSTVQGSWRLATQERCPGVDARLPALRAPEKDSQAPMRDILHRGPQKRASRCPCETSYAEGPRKGQPGIL